MAWAIGLFLQYAHQYIVQRNLSDKGCEHLSRADWKKLTILDLGDNGIGSQGCKHLSKADWKNLSTLNLRINEGMKRTMKLALKAAGIWARPTGRISSLWIYVWMRICSSNESNWCGFLTSGQGKLAKAVQFKTKYQCWKVANSQVTDTECNIWARQTGRACPI